MINLIGFDQALPTSRLKNLGRAALIPALALAVVGCGGGSDGGGGGAPAFQDQVGDTRNDGVFVFNNSPLNRYEQIDRMGVPVVASVVIRNTDIDGQNQRDRFNESDPSEDGDFATDIVPIVSNLHSELDDNLCAMNLTPCSRRDAADGSTTNVCDAPNGTNFSITNCAVQAVPQIVPDVLTYSLDRPDGFPNGRRLEDPVVDIVLGAVFLDINEMGDCRGQPCTDRGIADVPFNPPANELPFDPQFPFLASPHAVERENVE